jgi:ring-1,2-phenylacetyl-CoA epoxidase subunit PaaD
LNILEKKIRSILQAVHDPEVPVLSVLDLGIIRAVKATDEGAEIVLTPTYSGCPAMDVIKMTIRMALLEHGIHHFKLTTVLSPAWTTDWMSEEGKEKLKSYGIAPPVRSAQILHELLFQESDGIECPRCRSCHTRLVSQFGSTACKALYICEDCREPFDYFKCH